MILAVINATEVVAREKPVNERQTLTSAMPMQFTAS